MKGLRVAVLGPVEVSTQSERAIVGAAKECALLSLLALRAGAAVGIATLIDGLWGDNPPRSARKLNQTYVSNLRTLLPRGTIETVREGYRLQVDPDQVDALLFEALAAAGRRLAAERDAAGAAATLREALSLWRGPALVDLSDHRLGHAEAARLEETRRSCEEDLSDARLAAGEHAAAVADLEAGVLAEPLRERRWAQLMVALYRSGRQAEALRAYQRLHKTLADQLGLAPSTELRALERSILAQDTGAAAPIALEAVTTSNSHPKNANQHCRHASCRARQIGSWAAHRNSCR